MFDSLLMGRFYYMLLLSTLRIRWVSLVVAPAVPFLLASHAFHSNSLLEGGAGHRSLAYCGKNHFPKFITCCTRFYVSLLFRCLSWCKRQSPTLFMLVFRLVAVTIKNSTTYNIFCGCSECFLCKKLSNVGGVHIDSIG